MPSRSILGGVWSAPPTPLNSAQRLDVDSVGRLLEQHVRLGVNGVMLAGTCGEGPWLRADDRKQLTISAVAASAGRLRMALQVTDNSIGRVLANIEQAAAWGAAIAVVDAPWILFNGTPARKLAHYREIVRHSALPVGLYDRGEHSSNALPDAHLPELLAEPNLVMVKDSSQSDLRRDIYLKACQARPELVVLNGDEFNCVGYLRAGYSGLLLGGGVFNGALANRIMAAVRAGRFTEAERLQARMNDLMHRVYGGPKIECWLTGLKELLVQMGIFSTNANTLGYPLTAECLAQIRGAVDGSDGLGYREDMFGLPPM